MEISVFNKIPLTTIQDLETTAAGPVPGQRRDSPEVLFASNESESLGSSFTILDMLHGSGAVSKTEGEALPMLPSPSRARLLVDTVYFYTQARYCIVDWTKVREWHRDREKIAYISSSGSVKSQTGK